MLRGQERRHGRKKFNWVKENLPYCPSFTIWDRIWGPCGRGTPDSVKAMYNDPVIANRGELDWHNLEKPGELR